MTEQILDYFSRLTGKEQTGAALSADSPISLTSAQAGAALSWMRRSGVAFSEQRLLSKLFTVNELLAASGSADGKVDPAASPRERVQIPPSAGSGAAGLGTMDLGGTGLGGTGLGIDIESLSSMPVCTDYREHPFFVDHFTVGEIAYCICQPDPRQSFCGLWAAKEAVLKATGEAAHPAGLRSIEIVHDADGRPMTAGALLSISHAGESCVAVAFVPGADRAEMRDPLFTEADPKAVAEQPSNGARSRMVVGSMVTATGLICAALGFTLGQMPW